MALFVPQCVEPLFDLFVDIAVFAFVAVSVAVGSSPFSTRTRSSTWSSNAERSDGSADAVCSIVPVSVSRSQKHVSSRVRAHSDECDCASLRPAPGEHPSVAVRRV